MSGNIYIYVLVMAVVTYLIRVLPLTLIRSEIKNKYIKAFLYYVPYVTLSVMTVPAIFYATDSRIAAAAGFAVALFLAIKGFKLMTVALGACSVVFILELFL